MKMLTHAYEETGIPVFMLVWPEARLDQWIYVQQCIAKMEPAPLWMVWVLTGLQNGTDVGPLARTYAPYDRTYADWAVYHLGKLLESSKSVCPYPLLL